MTETREYAVRYWWTGTQPDLVLCDHPEDVRTVIEDLAADGFINMEPVTRPVAEWTLLVDELPATLRALAEAQHGDEATAPQVRMRLAQLLHVDPDALFTAWTELLEQIEEWRRADDGQVDWSQVEPELRDAEAYIDHHDKLVDEAVRRVIDEARKAGSR